MYGYQSSFPPIAAHHEVRLVRKIRIETWIDRAAGAFMHLEIIQEWIWRLGVIGRDNAAVLAVARLHFRCAPTLRLIRLPVEQVYLPAIIRPKRHCKLERLSRLEVGRRG